MCVYLVHGTCTCTCTCTWRYSILTHRKAKTGSIVCVWEVMQTYKKNLCNFYLFSLYSAVKFMIQLNFMQLRLI